jgi:hypothetical protein
MWVRGNRHRVEHPCSLETEQLCSRSCHLRVFGLFARSWDPHTLRLPEAEGCPAVTRRDEASSAIETVETIHSKGEDATAKAASRVHTALDPKRVWLRSARESRISTTSRARSSKQICPPYCFSPAFMCMILGSPRSLRERDRDLLGASYCILRGKSGVDMAASKYRKTFSA